MGLWSSRDVGDVPTRTELDDYVDLTYLNSEEILIAYRIFRSLSPKAVADNRHVKLGLDVMLTFPQLKMSPFGDQLCKVFTENGGGCCSFEDFLDMLSVLHKRAPLCLKTEYAFRLFDLDNDGVLGARDLRQLASRLVSCPSRDTDNNTPLSSSSLHHLVQWCVQAVMSEFDLDGDGSLSFTEFQHCVSKCPDFISSFTLSLL